MILTSDLASDFYLLNLKMGADPNNVKVYTVNGVAAGSSSSLPDWLLRKREAKGKQRAVRDHLEGSIELIQGFQFPEASNRIKTTRDGHHIIATGTYKPQMRVWDLDQLSLKFERHSDAENVDFVVCQVSSIQILQYLKFYRYFPMTGRKQSTYKMTGPWSYIHRVAFFIAPEFPASVVHSPIIFHLAMRIWPQRGMKCIV